MGQRSSEVISSQSRHDTCTGDTRTSLESRLDRVLAAIDCTDRFAHVEFVLTADGPEVVEVNPRIGGALVGEGLCRVLGVNAYEAMIESALGRRPGPMDADCPGGPALASVLGYPAAPGVFTGVNGLDRLADMPGTPAWYPVLAIRALVLTCCGVALHLPANKAYLVHGVDDERRPAFLSAGNATLNAGTAVGPPIAGPFVLPSPGRLFAAVTALFLAVTAGHARLSGTGGAGRTPPREACRRRGAYGRPARPFAAGSEERRITWSSPRRETGSRCESGTVPPL
ncbi:hypothetical protein GCM10022384_44210 [Streptomyces marokkonensis]|uniref:ATP-grasp domain-containing protein n=2 Tax=Streptomyces marokkonensis TaxID=324855 RepID=A0ABP7R383_9ACTN